MANLYRAPAVVVSELSESKFDFSRGLSLEQVVELRSTLQGEQGIEWVDGIIAQVAQPLATVAKEQPMTSEIRDAEIATPEAREELYGVDPDVIPDSIMAADAAMDAAQDLLEPYEELDPIICQAYYLIKAADAALGNAIAALGLVDPDDEMSMAEMPADPSAEVEMNSAETPELIEERKSAIATAERFEMSTEIRAMDSTSGELRIGGYAAQFNKEATGLSFREMIAPGAFKRTLQSGEPVYLLVNHDTNGIPLASTSGGTLNLSEDEVGLRMEANLDPANPKAQELFSAISRGDIAKMSFAFTVAPNGSTREEGLRTLEDVNLFEVSAVTWPAYNDTALGLRTLEDGEQEALELRKRLLELKQKFTK